MMVLVSYDVSTIDAAGRKRLRHVAKTCLNFGIRVQNSVFECNVDQAQWVRLRAKLTDIYEPASDSLRFYFLGDNYQKRIEHLGAKPAVDVEEPLIL
ncbi:MAG: CRISPR-associated endonuclease Cas2 [Lentisphaeria bacterium]|jgi:CRISPR-associated protein Cas2